MMTTRRWNTYHSRPVATARWLEQIGQVYAHVRSSLGAARSAWVNGRTSETMLNSAWLAVRVASSGDPADDWHAVTGVRPLSVYEQAATATSNSDEPLHGVHVKRQ